MASELDLTPAPAVYGFDIVHYIGRIMAFGVFILFGIAVLTACCLGKENTEGWEWEILFTILTFGTVSWNKAGWQGVFGNTRVTTIPK